MSELNGVDLDLSGFVGDRVTISLRDYVFTLPPDLPLSTVARIGRALTLIGNVAQGQAEARDDQLAAAEADIWKAIEEIMALAEPSASQPVRELFSTPAATALLNFLVAKFRGASSSTNSSESSPSSEERSPSENSSEALPSTAVPGA